MSRRVSLPGADELFRSTRESAAPASEALPTPSPVAARETERSESNGAAADSAVPGDSAAPTQETQPARGRPKGSKGSSGRVRHDEKITVYVTADELHDLESTRLALRRDHALAVDRGRIVREAIMLALEAVEAEGEDSPLVQRLRAQ